MPAAARNYRGATYMPLELKGVFLRYGLKQPEWARAVIQSNGRPISLTSASLLINWGTWPKTTSEESIRSQTEFWLRGHGVAEADIAGVWGFDGDDRFRSKHPIGAHVGRAPHKKHLTLVEPDIDPIGEPEMLSAAAKKLFSLFRDPFSDDVQGPDDIYLSADQRYIREAMLSTAKHGGFLAVVGESGAGKTVLRKDLIDRISRDNHPISIIQPRSIDKGKLTARAIFEAIVSDMQPDAKIKQSNEANARQAERLLRESSRSGNTHALVIEEAHDLSIQTLKSLKRFWEMEDGFKRLLGIILIGQPELKAKLDERQNFEAREVIRRCEVAELLPLDRNLEDYLALKLKRVGMDAAKVFAADAYDAIRARLTRQTSTRATTSMLYPLVVNNLATKAMNLAAEIGAEKVSAEVIREL